MKRGKSIKRGRYFGDVRFKNVSLLPLMFVMVLLLNLIMPVVALASPDDEKKDAKTEEKTDDKKDGKVSKFTTETNVRTNADVYKGMKPYLGYSKELHKEMVTRILKDTVFRSERYKDMYTSEDAGLSKKGFGNTAVFMRMSQDSIGDKAADGKEPVTPHGLLWSPAYMLDKDGKIFKTNENLYMITSGSKKSVERPIFMGDLRDYNIKSNKKTRQMGLSFDHKPMLMYGIGIGIGTNDNMIVNRKVKDKGVKERYENYLVKHSLYKGDPNASMSGKDKGFLNRLWNIGDTADASYLASGVEHKQYTAVRTKNNIGDGTDWGYAVTRASLRTYGAKMSVGTDDAGLSILGIDSYGNVITKNLDVVIPSWNNNIFAEFSSVTGNKKFMSQAIMKKYGKNSALLKTALTSKENTFYEGLDSKTKPYIDPIFEGGYKPGKKNKLVGGADNIIEDLYSGDNDNSKAFLGLVADLIVEKTGADVKAWNERFTKTLDKDDKMEAYAASSNGKYSDYSANNIGDAEDAVASVYDAKSILERIGRIMDIGFFELIRLTVASMVADFYNSTIINYSVGDIFYTKLLTESDLWKKAINTLLIIVVSFMSVYLILLVVRMFMGHITAKGILLRFVLLTIATVSPMIVYSPLINLAFNKPVDLTLGKELDRMFMLDVWLKKWETRAEETDSKMNFLPKGNLRERKEEYTVPIYTSTHTDGYNLNTTVGMNQAGNDPVEGKVVVVNVSAFHLIDWLEKGDGLTLFDYLSNAYPTEYDNIDQYKEFAFDTSINLRGIHNYKGDRVRASTVLRRVYNDLVNEEYVKEPAKLNFNTTLFETTNKLFGGESFNQAVVDQTLFDLSTTSYARKKIYGGSGKDNPYSGPTKKLAEELNLDLPKDDIFGIRDTVKRMAAYRLNSTSDLSGEVTDINRKVMDDYVYNYMKLRTLVNSTEYNKAEKQVLLMKIWFEINETLDIPLFPTKYDQSSVTLDTYIRALFIPLNEFKPTASDVDNVAKYITVRSDLVSTLMFALSVLMLFLYGMIKFFVLFVLLMPLILASFFYNYVWLENTKSKAWVGALGIMGSFALINLGLMLLWKGLIYTLNVSVYESAKVGNDMYPATLLHSLAIMVYLVLAFQFILRPLARTVKSDIGNLGGTRMADRAVSLGGDVKAGMKNFWNNLKDPGSTIGKTRVGNGMMSAISAAKNSLGKGRKGTDSGMAGELDPKKILERRSKEDLRKDEADLSTIDKKLDEKSATKGTANANATLGGTKANGGSGAGASVGTVSGLTAEAYKAGEGTVAQRKAYRDALAKAGRASAGVAGVNSMKRVFGLGGIGSGAIDDRNLFEKLKDAKNAAGRAWIDANEEFDSTKSANALAKARDLIRKGEKIDAIPDLENEPPLSKDEMGTLEELGMDQKVVGVDDRTGMTPAMLDVGLMSGLVGNAIKGTGISTAMADGKIVLDMSEEDMKDASKRKQLLMPVLTALSDQVDAVTNSRMVVANKGAGVVPTMVTPTSYAIAGGALTGHVLTYVNKLKSEGLDVSVVSNADGSLALNFNDADVASEAVSKIAEGSYTIAKTLGIVDRDTYDVDSRMVGALAFELDKAGVSYEKTSLSNGDANFVVTGDDADVLKFEGILSDHDAVGGAVTRMAGGIDVVEENLVVSNELTRQTNSGMLTEGVDYAVGGDGSISLMSTDAKRVVAEVQDTYSSRVNQTVSNLQDMADAVSNTIVGEPNGLNVSTYSAGVSEALDSAFEGSNVARVNYGLNNASFDTVGFDSLVSELSERRYTNEMAVSSAEEALRKATTLSSTLEQDLRSRVSVSDLLSANDGAINTLMLDPKNASAFSGFNVNESSVSDLKGRLASLGNDDVFSKAFDASMRSVDASNGNEWSSALTASTVAKEALNTAKKAESSSMTDLERHLLNVSTEAKAKDISWNRTGDTGLTFTSTFANQEKLVEDIVSSYAAVSKAGNKSTGDRRK